MSIKRLSIEERATYLIGMAVRRQFQEAPSDPDTVRENEAVMRWLEHWLTPDEQLDVGIGTGYVIDDDVRRGLEDMLEAARPHLSNNTVEPDDLIPF